MIKFIKWCFNGYKSIMKDIEAPLIYKIFFTTMIVVSPIALVLAPYEALAFAAQGTTPDIILAAILLVLSIALWVCLALSISMLAWMYTEEKIDKEVEKEMKEWREKNGYNKQN